ncbi:LysR family transcriptional regulator [Micrococcales bacterium 31B]|nr:LysR family transcriptional regulator [Micrococcales bacterium 31B]
MEVHQLRVLREVADRGSVTAAAAALYISPSAVSQHLAALQKTVSLPLTERRGRQLALTDAGKILAESTGAVLAALDAARASIDDYQRGTAQRVTLSAFHSAAQTLLGPLLAHLSARLGDAAPHVHCFDEDVPQDHFAALTAEYDLVLAHRMTHTAPWPTGRVSAIRLLTEPFDVVLATTHPAAGRPVGPRELVGLRWVVSRQGYSPDDTLAALYSGTESSPEVVHRINDYATAAQIVAASDLAALVPRHTAGIRHLGGITQVPLRGARVARSIDLLARPDLLQRRAVAEVVESLRAVAANTLTLAPARA